jgi:hypothetical protein
MHKTVAGVPVTKIGDGVYELDTDTYGLVTLYRDGSVWHSYTKSGLSETAPNLKALVTMFAPFVRLPQGLR